jgi:hypothetical protein
MLQRKPDRLLEAYNHLLLKLEPSTFELDGSVAGVLVE